METEVVVEQDGEKSAEQVKDRTGVKVAAVAVLVAVVMAGLWGTGAFEQERGPKVCGQPGPADPPKYLDLCTALNRPDLPSLLGTPGDHVSSAGPGMFSDGVAVAEIRLERSVVAVTDSQSSVWTMAGSEQFHTERATVLGHPAVTYSSNALVIIGKHDQPGPVTRNLIVATDPKDPGSPAYQFAVFRQDNHTPEDADLRRVAEAVLPTLPGWNPTQ
ncbi:DUF6215 domain-containing protein [Kitasatospora sp. NPDC048538]|uniref:DUF6215 domain-containing protein n=1 Tax=unclassified Kitasatospora TaxID=2633591 RepID=UPI0033C1D52D